MLFRNVGATAQSSLVAGRNIDGSPTRCPTALCTVT